MDSLYLKSPEFSWPELSRERVISTEDIDTHLWSNYPTIAETTITPTRSSVDFSRIPAYYQIPFSNHGNGCAQSAMASMLCYWNVFSPDPNLPETFYSNGAMCPDIFWGVFGTSWQRMRDVFAAYNLKVVCCNEPRLTVHTIDGKYDWLYSWVDAGYPACVIVGNGEMGGGAGAHWAIVADINPTTVMLANFRTPNGIIPVSTPMFMNAWQAYGLPGVHYATVIPSI